MRISDWSSDVCSSDLAWRVAAFRAYADHMAEPEFALARERLMRMAGERRVGVMCAEAVWWRCHRRLIADDFIARGWQVGHLVAPRSEERRVGQRLGSTGKSRLPSDYYTKKKNK